MKQDDEEMLRSAEQPDTGTLEAGWVVFTVTRRNTAHWPEPDEPGRTLGTSGVVPPNRDRGGTNLPTGVVETLRVFGDHVTDVEIKVKE